MKKSYYFISPAMEPARGRTRELIEELDALWLAGKNEGAGEICAALHTLADEKNLPYVFRQMEGSPTVGMLRDILKLLTSCDWKGNALFERILKGRSEQTINLDAAGVSCATGGLHAALQGLGAAGGEVITTSFNYIGVVNAIKLAGARPRFVDIDPRTWCMDPGAARAAVNDDTRAILLTHFNHFADLAPFYDICEGGGRNIPLVQDASLAIGSKRAGLRPGFLNIGRPGATVMSFTISKIISGLGGAIVVSDSSKLIERVQVIAHQGLNLRDECIVDEFGANYKLSYLNAAIAREMLKRFDEIVGRRREIRARYDEAFAPLAADGLIELQGLGADDAVTYYGILLPKGAAWREFAKLLFDRHGIIMGRWHCLHQEEIYKRAQGDAGLSLPVTEEIGRRMLFLPLHTGFSDEDAKHICEKTAEEIRRL